MAVPSTGFRAARGGGGLRLRRGVSRVVLETGAGYCMRSAFTARLVTPGTARSASSEAARIASMPPSARSSAFFVTGPIPGTSSSSERKRRDFAEAFARAVREAVRLVARPREEEERRTVRLQGDAVFLAGQIDAIDEGGRIALLGLGRCELRGIDVRAPRDARQGVFLREPDDGELVQAEIARGRERDVELAAAAVDDEEIGQIPVDALARALRLLPRSPGLRAFARFLGGAPAPEATREHLVHGAVVVAVGATLRTWKVR